MLIAAAAASLAAFLRWESRIAHPIVQIALFRNRAFAAITLAGVLMYLVSFSVLLIVPYFFVRYTALPLPLAGALLATGFAAMAAVSPGAGWLVGRIAAERIAPLGALVTGLGLFLIGEWQPDTPPQFMLFALALQGLGMGLFQVAYMEIVMAASPLAYRGVAGSLSMLTRTIGVVTAAAGLTLAFQALQGAASAQGAGEAQAFLSAFRNLFHVVGIAAALTGTMVAWARRRPR
ncbi:MAG: hypothetical protein AUG47_02025 [Alphaproteobacteria bacterium 13_1_20CM_3_64_12]|nr:MAG: hypothetical protein AUG47_02025 [Alphaproteobacteria bacterium 13_1_20CM_3_64_12]